MKSALIAIFTIMLFTPVMAQKYKQKWTIGMQLGASSYIGDIRIPVTQFDSTVLPAVGVFGMYHANDRIGIVVYGQITGLRAADSFSSSEYWKTRNLSFSTLILETGARLDFAFLPYQVNLREPAWAPYLSIGGFFAAYNPTTVLDGKRYALRTRRTGSDKPGNGYPPFMFGPSLGGGFKYNYKKSFTVGIHFDYKFTNTDWLDDISGYYLDPNTFSSGEEAEIDLILHDRSLENSDLGLAEEERRRDSDLKKDRYWTLSLFGSYTFSRSYCPPPGSRKF